MGDPALSRRGFLAASAAAGLGMTALTACGGDSDGGSSGTTTIEWWNISTTQPAKGVWAALARKYEAQNPKVKIKIVQMENDAYKSKMTALTASGKLPDIFHTWGGGVLKQQVDAGLVENLTDRTKPWGDALLPVAREPYLLDDQAYGIPFDIGMIGFWYNKALFEKAGIAEPPTTWSDFLDAVRKLKAAEVTPLALAGKEKWPGMYYWAYLAMRTAGAGALQKAYDDKDFTTAPFVEAGEHLKELVGLRPFQKGYLGAAYSTPTGQAAAVGNGKAAMELMGQWAPPGGRARTRGPSRGPCPRGPGPWARAAARTSVSSRSPRSRAARAPSPRCSAEAAGTHCAAEPLRRPSTSSSSSHPRPRTWNWSRRPVCCPWSRRPRAPSPTPTSRPYKPS